MLTSTQENLFLLIISDGMAVASSLEFLMAVVQCNTHFAFTSVSNVVNIFLQYSLRK